MEELATFEKRPLDFVHWAFPWGEPGELETASLENWQRNFLAYLQERLSDYDYMPIRVAIKSGHGIGKSSLLAMTNLWAFTTFEDTRGVITANNENQLRTKTWPEMRKWHKMFIGKELFQQTASALFPNERNFTKEWRLDILPWSDQNPAAFAGLHNKGKRICFTFDEASAIPETIFDAASGCETDANTQIFKFLFGNPTVNSGYFFNCFYPGKYYPLFTTGSVDSREVNITNKDHINRMIEIYGEDDDFIKVRFKGEFIGGTGSSFIDRRKAQAAANRKWVPGGNRQPVVLGVDIGHLGDDYTVIYPRQGLDGQSREVMWLRKADTLQNVVFILKAVAKYRPTTVFIDKGYVGASILDILWNKDIRGTEFIAVDFGSKPDETNELRARGSYFNKRAEIWGAMRAWLDEGYIVDRVPGLPNGLVDELVGPTYSLQQDVKILLESKAKMRARNVPSPNIADALACTFALPAFDVNETRDHFDTLVSAQRKEWNPYESMYS